jgi:hypothetical protein
MHPLSSPVTKQSHSSINVQCVISPSESIGKNSLSVVVSQISTVLPQQRAKRECPGECAVQRMVSSLLYFPKW